MPEPPRLTDETRKEAMKALTEAFNARGGPSEQFAAAANGLIDVLWPKLLGDARDRTAGVLHAARALLESESLPAETVAARRRGLRRALDELDHPAAWEPGAKAPSDE